jgi:hypothetical protein|tara:strand:+ start:821 stop:1420 length:600 start_codon:yes stop_codon:yes gene_type:complete
MAISEKAINFMQENMERGQAIPGQSLTNSPDEKYQWEKAPEFTNPRETMLYVFETLTVPETTANILLSINNGVSIIDIASITLYSGFLEGKWNPDLMTILMEPTMYMIMALAEKAGIDYQLEAGDNDRPEQMSGEKAVNVLQGGINELDKIRKQSVSRVNPQSVPTDIREIIEEKEIQPSLLERLEKEKPTSLLGRGEE